MFRLKSFAEKVQPIEESLTKPQVKEVFSNNDFKIGLEFEFYNHAFLEKSGLPKPDVIFLIIKFSDAMTNTQKENKKTIIFLDEIQNLSSTELHTVVTRIGRDSALVLAGDFFQNDLSEGESGLREFYEIAKRVKSFRIISFQERDIVRNEFIKEYIIAKNVVEKERKERKQFSGHRIERNYLNSITINGKEHQVVEMPVN